VNFKVFFEAEKSILRLYGEQSIADNKLIISHFLINEFNDELHIRTIYNNMEQYIY